ncbi:MAG TPA: signal peptidase I, partial [Bacillota bacterium]|nr:signal peptidase I [Bacillota bacterium]
AAKQAYRFGEIEYEDIIIFKSETDKEKLLIKRVIGLPGDVITISDGIVYRTGEILKEDYIMGGESATTPGEIYNFEVPEGQVFVMGDNRQVSLDSRSDMLGTISKKSIKGKAVFRFYPFSDAGKIH